MIQLSAYISYAIPACLLTLFYTPQFNLYLFLAFFSGIAAYTFLFSRVILRGRPPKPKYLNIYIHLTPFIFTGFIFALKPTPFLHHYIQGIVYFSWITSQLAVLSFRFSKYKWIGCYLTMLSSFSLLTIVKYPWKYEYDFAGYYLNLCIFPCFIFGLYYFLLHYFNRKIALLIVCPLVAIFLFPVRFVFKVLTGALPPNGWSSAFVLLMLVGLGMFIAKKISARL